MAEKKSSPQLRFPGFEGEWEEKKLGEFFSSRREKGNSSLPIYSVSQSRGLVPRESLNRNIQNDANPKDNLVVQPTDLAYNMMRMWQGAVGIANEPCMVSPAYVVLKAKIGNNSLFFLYLFEKRRSRYLFTVYSYGLTLDRLRLYYKDFANIKLSAPQGEEQQKIASFLTSVDYRIQLLQKKEVKLEEYKKGVMQKLFSKEIRFKDENGNDFPDWKEEKLGSLCEISKGKQLNKSELTATGEYPSQNGGIEPSGYTHQFNRNENTITISEGGNSSGYVNFMRTKFWCGGHCYALINLRSSVLLNFLFQSLKYNQRNIMRLRVGSGLPNIQKGDISNFTIEVPSKQEQQKIATFLNSLDSSIDGIRKEIRGNIIFKNGLLQKMFV